MTQTARNHIQDVAKGLAIIAVVYAHVFDGLKGPGIAASDGFAEILFRFVSMWHMPIFFLFAGYNAVSSLVQLGVGKFIRRQIITIVPMYFLWIFLQEGLKMLVSSQGGGVNHPADIWRILDVWYHPIGQFWFLYALFICHLLYAFTANKPRTGVLISVIALGMSQLPKSLLPDTDLVSLIKLALYNLPFYFMGTLKEFPIFKKVETLSFRSLLITSLVVFLCSCALAIMMGLPARNIVYFPASASALCFVLLLTRMMGSSQVSAFFAVFGRQSLSIYLMHVIFAAGVRCFLLKLGEQHLVSHILIGTIVGAGMPIIAYYILRRLKLLKLFFLK